MRTRSVAVVLAVALISVVGAASGVGADGTDPPSVRTTSRR
ncbi:hypothetical protein [Halorussus marinus]|nr:hypothetical protein [Halorussus marinus]